MLAAVLLSGCVEAETVRSTVTTKETETTMQEYVPTYNYSCAADLVGEAIADINASGFEYDTIFSLSEYDYAIAKPYTVLVDQTFAFATGVICKDNAVIADGIPLSPTIYELDPQVDLDRDICWSAATDLHYLKRKLDLSTGKSLRLNYMWIPTEPGNPSAVSTDTPSVCAFVYDKNLFYQPEYDFMWFNWGDSILDVQSSLVGKGFNVEESLLVSNNLTTHSVSETLYGHDFYAYLDYNTNLQFTGGTYSIGGNYAEIADVFQAVTKDLITKYGDSSKLILTERFNSLDAMLVYMYTESSIDPYHFHAQLIWNVHDRTQITLHLYNNIIEIEYKSIASTGGTGLNEESLI